ncbi:MAG: J domain-containing protein [Planctomycetales bacterium]|nr:J domain-containing protein [Planctomycetales bacterium]
MDTKQSETLYDVLGVAYAATPEQIRLAFLKLAHQCHPDLNAGSSRNNDERFKQLRLAYETLSNPGRREVYNRTNGIVDGTIARTERPLQARFRNHSIAAFEMRLLKDRKRAWEKWFFVSSIVVSVSFVWWAAQQIPKIHQRVANSESVQIQLSQAQSIVTVEKAASDELEVPTNTVPIPVPSFQRHFKKVKTIDDQSVTQARRSNESRPKTGTQSSRVWPPAGVTDRRKPESEIWAFPETPPADKIPIAPILDLGSPAVPRVSGNDFSNAPLLVPETIRRIDQDNGFWDGTDKLLRQQVPLLVRPRVTSAQAEDIAFFSHSWKPPMPGPSSYGSVPSVNVPYLDPGQGPYRGPVQNPQIQSFSPPVPSQQYLPQTPQPLVPLPGYSSVPLLQP